MVKKIIAGIMLPVFLLAGCTTYKSQFVSFRPPEAYANKQQVDGIAIGGEAYADTAAAEVAVGLKAEKIIFLTDVIGICDNDKNLLPHLTVAQAQELIDSGVISGGMIPKAQACFRALDGVKGAHIIDGRVDHALIRELLTDNYVGTTIVR